MWSRKDPREEFLNRNDNGGTIIVVTGRTAVIATVNIFNEFWSTVLYDWPEHIKPRRLDVDDE